MFKGLKHLSKGCELLYKALKHMFKCSLTILVDYFESYL